MVAIIRRFISIYLGMLVAAWQTAITTAHHQVQRSLESFLSFVLRGAYGDSEEPECILSVESPVDTNAVLSSQCRLV